MSAVVIETDHWRRPRGWRHFDAWHETELAPCGEAALVAWHYWANSIFGGAAPDISDCLVAQPKPFRIVIWEPLQTKAPGPNLARPYCCYLQTVIFYGTPYVVWPYPKIYRGADDRLTLNSGPTFLEWDQIETRLSQNDSVLFNNEIFECGCGRVLWTAAPGERRRWWMRHGARRKVAR